MFNTIFGKYRFLRILLGLNVSQDIFQRKIEEALRGLPNHGTTIDDILLWANSKDEMLKNLRLTLQRCQERSIKLNLEKCQLMVSEIKYFGHVISVNGIKPDPQKIQGLRDFPIPKCKADIQSLLGMINYLRKFSTDIAKLTTPLRDLLKHDKWKWNEEHTQCFKNVIDAIAAPNKRLQFYDPQRPLYLQVDAFSHGLGAALMQDNGPVEFASRALSETEQKYVQIEKEMLAIVFGCKRFHQYIFGRRVEVHSDHKPLEAIMKKPLTSVSTRLQKLLLNLQAYDIIVRFHPGKTIILADALSRNHSTKVSNNSDVTDVDVDMFCANISEVLVHDDLENMRNVSLHDTELGVLRRYILHGWPDRLSKVNKSVR